PVLAWVRETLGASFVLAEGIAFVAQPAQSLSAASSAIPTDPWRLGAMHAVTTLTGSALIAIALARGALSVDAAWAAAHVDEDWNMKFWGRDALALERRAARFSEMQAAATVLEAACCRNPADRLDAIRHPHVCRDDASAFATTSSSACRRRRRCCPARCRTIRARDRCLAALR